MRVSYNQLPPLRDTYVCTLYTQTFSPSSQSLTPPIRKGPKLAAPSIGARAASAFIGGFLFFFTLGGFCGLLPLLGAINGRAHLGHWLAGYVTVRLSLLRVVPPCPVHHPFAHCTQIITRPPPV